jgi:hypothetical protein
MRALSSRKVAVEAKFSSSSKLEGQLCSQWRKSMVTGSIGADAARTWLGCIDAALFNSIDQRNGYLDNILQTNKTSKQRKYDAFTQVDMHARALLSQCQKIYLCYYRHKHV